jgi:hypothetical protein
VAYSSLKLAQIPKRSVTDTDVFPAAQITDYVVEWLDDYEC